MFDQNCPIVLDRWSPATASAEVRAPSPSTESYWLRFELKRSAVNFDFSVPPGIERPGDRLVAAHNEAKRQISWKTSGGHEMKSEVHNVKRECGGGIRNGSFNASGLRSANSWRASGRPGTRSKRPLRWNQPKSPNCSPLASSSFANFELFRTLSQLRELFSTSPRRFGFQS